mgnify:FL=1|tara:strand:+ start:366 stop:857 length:492 start_codon:yes stop_codon:yes gene_type:complete
MTKRLEELFDLGPNDVDTADVNEPLPQATSTIPAETLANIDKIETALPAVKGLEASDQEMDELGDLAKSSYKDLMDLGMNVDSRFASEIFGVASNMLSHAISAKTAKINKKLKMIDLQLKKAQLDQKKLTDNAGNESIETGQGYVLDRNDLLKELLKNKDTKQ